MRFLILTPTAGDTRTGNRCTAGQWSEILSGLGHDASVVESYAGRDADVLVALHAAHSRDAILEARAKRPSTRIVVALTGTDLYPALGEAALASLRAADKIVGLQPRARQRVPEELRGKVRIVIQSAAAGPRSVPRPADPFGICVVGHLREVKDPLRAALASRLLPASSKIRIRHAGAILEPGFRELVAREQAENPRYEWLGELPGAEVQALLASSRLQVLSSYDEGGGRVIGESAVAGTPLLAARNDATLSLLGEDYPGLFDAGATDTLAGLMERAEADVEYRAILHAHTRAAAAQFDPRHERDAWRELIAELERECS